MASECAESLKTVEYVESCPLNLSAWNERAKAKECSKKTKGKCNHGQDLVYHCLPNAYRNETVEVCAPPTYIPSDTCAEYNIKGKRINGAYNCSENIGYSCPIEQYSSINIIKYPGCLNISRTEPGLQDIPKVPQHVDKTGIIVPSICVPVVIIIIVSIFNLIRRHKRYRCCSVCVQEEGSADGELRDGEPLIENGIVLVGKTGSGKSSTGNSIFEEYVFEATLSATEVTNSCEREEKMINKMKLTVIDTPGICDRTRDEIKKSYRPKQFIIVVVKLAPLDQTDLNTLALIKEMFGDSLKDYGIVLFTHKDALERDKMSLKSFLAGPGDEKKVLNNFINECGNRYIAFDNTLGGFKKKFNKRSDIRKNKNQVNDLLEMMGKIISGHREKSKS